jgi:hypothetical protein
MDPEKAWEHTQELLPHDQRPEGWDARGLVLRGFGTIILTPPRQRTPDGKDVPADGILIVTRFRTREELDAAFDPGSLQNRGLLGFGEIRDPEPGTIEIQGRTVRCLRFKAWLPDYARDEPGDGSSLRVDVTGQGPRPVVVQIVRQGEEEKVPDELAQELLKPFDVWRGR